MALNYLMYLAIALLLFFLLRAYFALAEKYRIIDQPNGRSSHQTPTIRGGGVIFIVAAFIFSALNGIAFPYLMLALFLSGIVSFWDDIKSLPNKVRFFVHLVSGLLLLGEAHLLSLNILLILVILVLIIGVINAYNFMDGINGITGFYSLAILLPLLFTEQDVLLQEFEIFTLISVFVFLYFNARKKARCFAGDVGSVGLSLIVLFLLLNRMYATHNFNYVGFLLLYGVDTVLTIVQRLYLRENIFKAHRRHLFQLLSNEFKIPQLGVGLGYGLLQLAVNLYLMNQGNSPFLLLGFILISGTLYVFLKYKLTVKIREKDSGKVSV